MANALYAPFGLIGGAIFKLVWKLTTDQEDVRAPRHENDCPTAGARAVATGTSVAVSPSSASGRRRRTFRSRWSPQPDSGSWCRVPVRSASH
jgi:hypothetical protein